MAQVKEPPTEDPPVAGEGRSDVRAAVAPADSQRQIPRPIREGRAAGWIGAICAAAASLLLAWILRGALEPSLPILVFLPSVILAAGLGGVYPALVPLGSGIAFAVGIGRLEPLSLFAFILSALAVAVFGEALFRQRQLAGGGDGELASAPTVDRYKAAMRNNLDSFFLFKAQRDASGKIEDFTFEDLNPQGEHLLGMSREQLIGHGMCELLPANREKGFFDKYCRVMESGVPLEEEINECGAGHDDLWLHQVVVPIENGIAIITRDITARKRVEVELQTQASVLESMTEGVSLVDEEGIILYTNPAEDAMFGYEPGELLGRPVTIQNAYEPEENERIVGEVIAHLQEHGFWEGDWHNRKKDGTTFYTAARISRVEMNGKTHFVCVQRDITGQHKSEQELRQSEQRFRLALSNGSVVVYEQDVELRYLWLYPNASFAHALGKTDHDLLPAEEADKLAAVKRRAIETRQQVREEIEVTLRGSNVYYDLTVEPLFDEDGNLRGVGGAAFDITARKEFEKALVASRLTEREFQERLTALHHVEDELASAETEDEICRLAVTLGRSRLGFDRLGIWLCGAHGQHLHGTFGVDEEGHIRDERHVKLPVEPGSSTARIIAQELPLVSDDDAVLYGLGTSVGKGSLCAAGIVSGRSVLGCISVDNLLTQRPIDEQDRELLMLFATSLGHLIGAKRAQVALKESDDRYRAFVSHSSEAIWRFELEVPVDPNLPADEQIDHYYKHGYLAECNDAMARMYALERADQLVGARLGDLLVREDEGNMDYLRKFIANGHRLSDAESSERDANGEERFFLNNLVGIIINGKLERAWGTQRDVTEQRRFDQALRVSENRLSLALDAGHMGIWDWDVRSNELNWSPNLEPIHGMRPGEFDGTFEGFMRAVYEPDRSSVMEAVSRALEACDDFYVEFRVPYPDGSLHWVAGKGRAYRGDDGRPTRMIGVGMEITQRKEAEEQLRASEEEVRKLNEELERRVEERTAALLAANRELEGFSYSVSHDLRTPLRGISGFSKLLLDDYGDRLDDEGRDYLSRIMQAGFRMTDMIDDLLQYSRLGRREMRMEHVDLSALASEVAAELSEGLAKPVEIRIQPDMTVRGDGQLLRVALENLIGNGLKFAANAENPLIEFGRETHPEGNVFFIRDNGIGFDQQYVEKLFQPFERLHRSTDYPGTGIGLANVQRIIHRHGGRIWAEGRLGEGAAFYFTLGPKLS